MAKDCLAAATVANNIALTINDLLIPALKRNFNDSKQFYESYVLRKVSPIVALDGGHSLFAPSPSASSPAMLLAEALKEGYSPLEWMSTSILKLASDRKAELLTILGIDLGNKHADADLFGGLGGQSNEASKGLTSRFSFTHAVNNIAQAKEFCQIMRQNLEADFRESICDEDRNVVMEEIQMRQAELDSLKNSSTSSHHLTHAQFAGKFAVTFRERKIAEGKKFDDHRENLNEYEMFMQCLESIEMSFNELVTLEHQAAKDTFLLLRPLLTVPFSPLESHSFEITNTVEYNRRINGDDGFVRPTANIMRPLLDHLGKYFLTDMAIKIGEIFAERVARRVELIVLQKKFTLLGGLLLDDHVQALQQFFSLHCEGSVRAQFSRLCEVVSVLTVEDLDEFVGVFGNALKSGKMRLRMAEVKKILLSRVDLKENEIEETLKKINNGLLKN
eukprot:GDKJ01062157.1.p1 GENE.GDKJ01062157.1~~GDKJ01062157.1.p1  ORF type:complete len:459 (-),score=121.39 GDKJ01062157.1:42-1382(-)